MRCFFLFYFLLGALGGLECLPKESASFPLDLEEMVFASKLSDENRHVFCYTFSDKERKDALEASKEVSPNQGVESVVRLSKQEMSSISCGVDSLLDSGN